jgi:hypothetical protein
MNIAIFHINSPGLKLDAEIVSSTLSELLEKRADKLVLIGVPHRALDLPSEAIRRQININVRIDVAIFLERIINHPALQEARHRILIPNPEWMVGQSAHLAGRCTEFWHKSQFSKNKLTSLFPNARHRYIGFTSLDPGIMVRDYKTFVHLRGNLVTRRHSGMLVDTWLEHPEWPDLYTQFHGLDLDVELPNWLPHGNVHLRLGWMSRQDYLETSAAHGIHICTSEHEGFGHYINEARAMGALVVTTDAPPMNELVDPESGVLAKASEQYPCAFGTGFKIGKDAMETAIEQVLSLSPETRRALGIAGRERFIKEKEQFRRNIIEMLPSIT